MDSECLLAPDSGGINNETRAGARAAAARQRRRQRTAADTTTAHVHETPCSALVCLQSHWQRDRLPLAGYEIARNICVRTGTAPRVLVTARRACSRNSTQRTCASAATASPVQPEVLTEQRLTRLQCQRRPAWVQTPPGLVPWQVRSRNPTPRVTRNTTPSTQPEGPAIPNAAKPGGVPCGGELTDRRTIPGAGRCSSGRPPRCQRKPKASK